MALHTHRIVHMVPAVPGQHSIIAAGKWTQPIVAWACIEHRDHEPWETIEAVPAMVGSIESLVLTCRREYDVADEQELAIYCRST